MDRERATYDPDLPHAYMAEAATRECAVCGGYNDDELHRVEISHERASEGLLVTEKGS